jgi:hypothetical protein
MTHFAAPLRFARPWLAATACVALTGGCSSVITSAYLREAWLDTLERATDGTDADEDPPAAARSRRRAAADAGADAVDPAPAPLSLAEAVAAAETRLADAGGLSEAARGTLVTMLESTPPQDWPVVVEEFAAALAAGSEAAAAPNAKPTVSPAAAASENPSTSSPREHVAVDPVAAPPTAAATVPAAVSAAAVAPVPPVPPSAAASTASPVSGAPVIEPVAASASQSSESQRPAVQAVADDAAAALAAAATPALSIVNACFASRVRAWGVVDRFETSRFRPGQQVILYFEIENLSSRQSADGHSTRVDTRLVLLAADGTRLHEWTFDPLEETCLSKRRDYFARYVLELPAALPPGPCRLELAVEDALAGRTAVTTLPLEISGR